MVPGTRVTLEQRTRTGPSLARTRGFSRVTLPVEDSSHVAQDQSIQGQYSSHVAQNSSHPGPGSRHTLRMVRSREIAESQSVDARTQFLILLNGHEDTHPLASSMGLERLVGGINQRTTF